MSSDVRDAWVVGLACLALAATADAGRLHLRKPSRGFQLRMVPFVIQPGTDREGCEYAVAPNRHAMDVSTFELKTTPGTHHFVVWAYLGADRNPADFWSGVSYTPGCVGLGPQNGANNANLFGMLSGYQHFQFPPGVAVRLPAHAILYPDLHFHNYGDTPVDGQAVVNFIPARPGTVRHHAEAFTVGSFDIDIPPLGTASLTGEWHTTTPLNVVQLSTHEHHRGTGVTIDRLDANGVDQGELVHTTDWEHPTTRWFEQAMRIEPGEGFRFTCEWSNPDDHPVHFGVTTEDEMCFMTGYFYSDDDLAPLSGPGCVAQGSGLECFVPKS
jgi:hypothetical protein